MKYHLVIFTLTVLISFGGVLLFNGCSASDEFNPSKMDTSLNQKIAQLEKEDNPEAIIQFTGKTSTDINEQVKSGLEGTGIIIETVAGNIFTANGTSAGVKKVSMLDYVVYLELAKKLDIK